MPARVFRTRAEVEASVAMIPTTTDKAWRQRNGPRYRLEFSPGSVRITSTDYSRSAKTDDRAQERRLRKTAAMLVEEARVDREHKRGTIKDMSQKSRQRMPLVFATLDYSKMFEQGDQAAMVTLTYPAEWHRLTPDGPTFKSHVNALRERYLGTWGNRGKKPWAGIWKMEFQGRGAPHLHVGTVVPEGRRTAPLSAEDQEHLTTCGDPERCEQGAHTGRFEFADWLSRVWSQIVFKDHAEAPTPWSVRGWRIEQEKHQRKGAHVSLDEGRRYSDPKRIGIYFAKHGLFEDKAYQNVVPSLWHEGARVRFWGSWVVKPLIVSKETHEALIMHIVRHLRALADRNSYSRKETLVKGGHNPRTGEIWEPRPRKRAVHRRVKRWRNRMGYGYVVVNDGTAMAADIARIVSFYAGAFIVAREDLAPSDFFDEPAGSSPLESAAGAGWDHLAPPEVVEQFAGLSIGRGDFDGSPPVKPAPVGQSKLF